MNNKNNIIKFAWFCWGVGAAFYFAHYIVRVFPSIMLPELVQEFHVNSIALGNLAALFYIAYVAAQIPAGMLVDRYGPRKLLIIMTLLSALSLFLYAFSNKFSHIEFSRALLGLASAFAFISAAKLIKNWFPSRRLASMVGLTQCVGMIGAAIGSEPMERLTHLISWHTAIVLMAIVFILIAALGFFFLKDHPKKALDEVPVKTPLLESFSLVLSNSQTWINAVYVAMIYAPTVVFGEFWGASFLEHAQHLSAAAASFSISLSFVGWAMGSVVLGNLSDRLHRRRHFMIASAVLTFLMMSAVLYFSLSISSLHIFMFLFGFVSAGASISYALAGEINPTHVSGTSVAFANMASVLVGALIQPLIGHLLHWHSSGKLINKVPVYGAGDYRFAMSVLTVCLVVAIIASLCIKETYAKAK